MFEFLCYDQFFCLAFTQLTYREILKDMPELSSREALSWGFFLSGRSIFAFWMQRLLW